MAKDELFERNAHPKAQDFRAKPSDRSRRELDDHRPLFVSPKLGVNRTVIKPHSGHGPGRCGGHRMLNPSGQSRRRDVDGFLEERALERIGLVEKCQALGWPRYNKPSNAT